MSKPKTEIDHILSQILIWLPSLAVILFYIPNALDKIMNHDQTGKVVESSAVMITAGIFIFIGIVLFLYHKTILIGTSMLVLYMTFIVFIHLYKGKPAEIVILILIATVFSSYIRKPNLFLKTNQNQA